MTDRIDQWPVAIIEDRYTGSYSRGSWIAIAEFFIKTPDNRTRLETVYDGAHGDDGEAASFWKYPPEYVSVGHTPEEALVNLRAKHGR